MSIPVAVSRASWRPHWVVLAFLAVSAAACSSDTTRFDDPFSNPFASKSAPAADVTGSIGSQPAKGQIQSQPLPPVAQTNAPATKPAAAGVAGGGRGFGSYRPGSTEITGSVSPPPAPKWEWNGGTPVTVGQGETLEMLAHRYGVPASAIMRANGLTAAADVRAGRHLVIPRMVSAAATPAAAASRAAANPAPAAQDGTHVVTAGETMLGIARRYQVSVNDLAKANHIEPYAQIKMGDRLVIPGHAAPAAKAAQAVPHPKPVQKVASAEPAPAARSITPTANVSEDGDKTGSANPSFRWPVKGRIIAGFGPKPNGQQNDGINLAVPEGAPIKAADDGVVAYAGNELKGYGNLVLIRHSNGFVTAYAHASELLVKRGDQIKRGQVIARAGESGNVSSPQLHFEIRKGSSPVDPTRYLSGA
ncbi:MAG TPA: LysM peptidoglycan-binding domain-containing M23 family metallopeptidase [Xanthobacteraceae bacterium]|nr:LysM peptidoglycan-binding domain-containing M23 family metallopeptidase [Xanthobacteraceae bacterium]